MEYEELSEEEFRILSIEGKLKQCTLYVVYYDKQTCILCQKEFKRSYADENPNFCPECLKRLEGEKDERDTV